MNPEWAPQDLVSSDLVTNCGYFLSLNWDSRGNGMQRDISTNSGRGKKY